jgi:single-stranded-DNA-specific exonuclease
MPEIIARPIDAAAAEQLITAGYSPVIARIFSARAITHSSQLEHSLVNLLPVSGLKNAGAMAILLADAITAHKKLLVIADYDCDGATACAVAMRGLRMFGAQVDFIVPNRFEYGYGLTPEIVRLAAQGAPDILITVDNGIASVDGVNEANRLGMQVLVTDQPVEDNTHCKYIH